VSAIEDAPFTDAIGVLIRFDANAAAATAAAATLAAISRFLARSLLSLRLFPRDALTGCFIVDLVLNIVYSSH